MKQAEFAELSREVMPVLDKLTEIAGQHGTAEKLVSITLSAEGYIHFTVRDSVQAFLHETYKLVCGIAQAPRPHIFCKDGFEMSVQAGDGLYCEPRVNLESGEYATCEVGYPSQKEELLMPYIEDPTEPTKAVYPYVPVEVIEQVIEKHGGWFDARIPFA